MSDSDRQFFDPHTGQGVLLDDAAVPVLRIHECGAMVIDAGWNYRGVRSPFWRAYYNPDPGAAVRAAGRRHALGPEHVLILPEGVVYDCLPAAGARHFWIHCFMGTPQPPSAPFSHPLDPIGRATWMALHDAAAHGPVNKRALRCACAAALLNILGALDELQPAASQRLLQLLAWLEQSLAMPPTLDDMAARAGMGRRSFLRWFQSETGITPVEWLTRRRIREACRLLRFGDASIEQVAEATGFANRHHFSRTFAARMGMGPAAFRRGGQLR